MDEKMKLTNHHHIIFEESNYTEVPINDNKMEVLYQKQENIFQKNQISSYIFVVENIYETQEKIESVVDHLYNYLENYFQINLSNSVIALFSMEF